MVLISILAFLSMLVVLILIVWSYIRNKSPNKRIIHFTLSGAALVSAILNTATIIGGERSLLLTLIILMLCAMAYLEFEKGSRKRTIR